MSSSSTLTPQKQGILASQILLSLVFGSMLVCAIYFLYVAVRQVKATGRSLRKNKKIVMLSLNIACLVAEIPWLVVVYPHYVDPTLKTQVINTVNFWILSGYICTLHWATMCYMLFGWIEAVAYIQSPAQAVESHPRKTAVVASTSGLLGLVAIAGVIIMALMTPITRSAKYSRYFQSISMVLFALLAVAFVFFGAKLNRLIGYRLGANPKADRSTAKFDRLNKLNIILSVCCVMFVAYFALIIGVKVVPSTFHRKLSIPVVFLVPCLLTPASVMWFFSPRAAEEKEIHVSSDTSSNRHLSASISVSAAEGSPSAV